MYGVYVMRWTIHHGVCTDSTDDVEIAYDQNPTTAAAGTDQEVCALVTTLAGNSASVGTGTWTKVSGPGTVTFSDSHSATSTATAGMYGVYVMRWTIHNGVCTDSTDDVQITYDQNPTTAAAGTDQEVCARVTTLAGNSASVGTGTWTKVSGPGTVTFSDSHSATSTATA